MRFKEFPPKSRLWNLRYADLRYENGRTPGRCAKAMGVGPPSFRVAHGHVQTCTGVNPVVYEVYFLDPEVREIDPSKTNISRLFDFAV